MRLTIRICIGMDSMTDNKRLAKYLLVTFLITWVCWWGDALLVKVTSLTESNVFPMVLFTMGGFGPTIAACFCMEGGFTKKNLRRFLFNNTKKNWLTILAIVVVETIAFFICSEGLLPSIPRSPIAAIVVSIIFIQAVLLYGGNEELGWRGTMLPILEKKVSAPLATLIVGIVWVIWHIPLWFIEGNSHQSMSFIWFAALGLALSYWLSMVYDATKAVIFCMILHGWTNTLMGVVNINPNPLYYVLLLAMTAISMIISIQIHKKRENVHS